ncbi:MAG: ribosome maturation factor RimM [Thiohalomonadales bacterium]
MPNSNLPQYIEVGHIGSAYGLKGWVNIISYTQPKTNIIEYRPWYLKTNEFYQLVEVEQIRQHGKGIVALLPDCIDRTTAESLKNIEIAILPEQLPEPDSDEYYWHDLIGLNVNTINNVELGKITDLIETGANDVLVVEQQLDEDPKTRLIPFIRPNVVTKIDLTAKLIVVDWDPDF